MVSRFFICSADVPSVSFKISIGSQFALFLFFLSDSSVESLFSSCFVFVVLCSSDLFFFVWFFCFSFVLCILFGSTTSETVLIQVKHQFNHHLHRLILNEIRWNPMKVQSCIRQWQVPPKKLTIIEMVSTCFNPSELFFSPLIPFPRWSPTRSGTLGTLEPGRSGENANGGGLKGVLVSQIMGSWAKEKSGLDMISMIEPKTCGIYMKLHDFTKDRDFLRSTVTLKQWDFGWIEPPKHGFTHQT